MCAAASGVRLEEVRCFVAVVVGPVFWTFFGVISLNVLRPCLSDDCLLLHATFTAKFFIFFKGKKKTRHRCTICSSHPSKFCVGVCR